MFIQLKHQDFNVFETWAPSDKRCLLSGLVLFCFQEDLGLYKTSVISFEGTWQAFSYYFLFHIKERKLILSPHLTKKQQGVKNEYLSCSPNSTYCFSLKISRILPKPLPGKREKRISFDSCYCHCKTSTVILWWNEKAEASSWLPSHCK